MSNLRIHMAFMAVLAFITLILPRPAQSGALFWDFEAGPSGFSGEGDWEWGIPEGGGPDTAYSGEHCWGTNLDGFYSHGARFFLHAPGLRILSEDATLSVASWYDFEEGHDGGNLQISVDQGATWVPVDPQGGYPDTVEYAFGKVPCFSHSSEGWEEPTFCMGGYQGEDVCLAFWITSDDSIAAFGWFIDDVEVLGATLSDSPVTEVGEETSDLEDRDCRLRLSPGAPNPFDDHTTIHFRVPPEMSGAEVRCEIYDLSGRLARVLAEGRFRAGEQSVVWDGNSSSGAPAAPGVYLVRLAVGASETSRRVVLLR